MLAVKPQHSVNELLQQAYAGRRTLTPKTFLVKGCKNDEETAVAKTYPEIYQ